ncbi:hypothetical protein EJB05_22456, partial [Eragrostis curvula]
MFIYTLRLITDTRRRRRLPPGPWTIPIIGSFHAVAWSRPHRSLARLAERYGPLMSIWVGRFPTVVVSSPDAAREVLRNADLAGRTVLDAWRAEGHAANSVIFLPPRDMWRALPRFATTELFAKGRLDARQLLRQEKAWELVRHVSERAASGEAVDVGHAVFVTAMDLMTCTFFSVDLATRELRHMVKAASLLAAKPTISDIFPAVAAADLQGARRKMGTLVRHGHRIFDQQFMRRRRERDAGEPSKDDMIDVMIDREHEWKQAGSPLNYDAVRGLFLDFLVAGTESASCTVEWAMAE